MAQHFVSTKPIAFLVCYFSLVLVVSFVRGEHTISNFFQLKSSQKKLEEHLHILENENADIAVEIEKIEGSSDYARKVLKDKYNLLEEGEEVLFFDSSAEGSEGLESL